MRWSWGLGRHFWKNIQVRERERERDLNFSHTHKGRTHKFKANFYFPYRLRVTWEWAHLCILPLIFITMHNSKHIGTINGTFSEWVTSYVRDLHKCFGLIFEYAILNNSCIYFCKSKVFITESTCNLSNVSLVCDDHILCGKWYDTKRSTGTTRKSKKSNELKLETKKSGYFCLQMTWCYTWENQQTQ